MHPILFDVGGVSIYSYGFMIALGAIAGVSYMAIQGKKEVGLTFDQANALFLFIFLAAIVGGKVFLFFEDIPYYLDNPQNFLRVVDLYFMDRFFLPYQLCFCFFANISFRLMLCWILWRLQLAWCTCLAE